MRVVSFVPSWTETLICAGVNVVGRTRYCIHPEEKVKSLAVVGGTKNILLESILALKPDLVIFDKEENNQEIHDLCLKNGLNCYATHVLSLKTCGEELLNLADLLNNQTLKIWGEIYLRLSPQSPTLFKECIVQGEFSPNENYQYVIWKKPFMVVARSTFIGDMLELFGIKLLPQDKKYPEISDDELKNYFCLFSSEPYPFAKYFSELQKLGYRGVLVDGEKLSWYGVRCLKLLKML